MSKLFIDRVPSPVPIPTLPPRGSRLDGAEGCLFVRPALRPARTAWFFCALVIRDIPGYSILKGWEYQKIWWETVGTVIRVVAVAFIMQLGLHCMCTTQLPLFKCVYAWSLYSSCGTTTRSPLSCGWTSWKLGALAKMSSTTCAICWRWGCMEDQQLLALWWLPPIWWVKRSRMDCKVRSDGWKTSWMPRASCPLHFLSVALPHRATNECLGFSQLGFAYVKVVEMRTCSSHASWFATGLGFQSEAKLSTAIPLPGPFTIHCSPQCSFQLLFFMNCRGSR